MSAPFGSPRFVPSRGSFSGSMTISGSLTVDGGPLIVSGSSVLSGSTTVYGNFAVSGSTNLSGSTSIFSVLNVTGSTILSGSDTKIIGSFTVTGSTNISGSATIAGGPLNVSGSTYLSGGTSIFSALNVTGSTILSGSDTKIIGSFTVTGSTNISGSTTISAGPLVVRGATYISGSMTLSGSTLLGICGDKYSLIQSGSADAMTFQSKKGNNAVSSGSFVFVADVATVPISASHPIMEFGHKESGCATYTKDWLITPTEISSSTRGTAEILGTELDGGASIGTVVGSETYFSTTGAKLLSVVNGTGSAEHEREFVDHAGSRTFGISDHTGSMSFAYWSELVTITGSFNDTVNTIPAGALCWGVGVRIITSIPTASFLNVGISGSLLGAESKLYGIGLVPSASVTNATSSMLNGPRYFVTASAVRLTPGTGSVGILPAAGTVRVEARYTVIVPPQA